MKNSLELVVMKGVVLGITTYRGIAYLDDLSRISRADIFDQKKNLGGTQRDLNVKHAIDAHDYVQSNAMAFWPEVVLCCRDEGVLRFEEFAINHGIGQLMIDLSKIAKIDQSGKIAISRLDGNHRLHFAAGNGQDLEPIRRPASFCLLIGLSREDEIALFRDINNNQRRMNTSHLDTIVTRLTPEERLMREDPSLYIAKRLGDDVRSPLYDRVFEGGKKSPGLHIPLRTLNTGITYLRQRSQKIEQLGDIEAEYLFIQNFWEAMKRWVPGAWEEPKKYIVLRGAGLWGVCMLGGVVIDKCLDKGNYTPEHILEILKSGNEWDWSNKGDFKGYSGRGGAVEIANKVSAEFSTESGVSIKRLAEKIKVS